jgi:glycine/D-amino acid oxidase-like deaminating enzyme
LVGQGLAGTLLAHFLITNGQSVLVIDQYNNSSSSNIAAGIIHPITGRRLVKSWLLDDAYPLARNTYNEIALKFKESFFKEIAILEIFTSIKSKNDWIALTAEDNMKYLVDNELAANEIAGVDMPYGGMVLKPTGYLNIKKMLLFYRSYFEENDTLLNEKFRFDDLIICDNQIQYKEFSAPKIIFCEGFHAIQNPYFKTLPYQFAKGEILILECEGLREDFIINKSIYIQPLGNSIFRMGATYEWNQLDFEPTNDAREKLTTFFAEVVKLPFRVLEHYAAVRPTVKGRRPLIGMHPKYKQIGIFNGLGTKGVLLAPYLAKHFTEHLLFGKPMMQEVAIENYI